MTADPTPTPEAPQEPTAVGPTPEAAPKPTPPPTPTPAPETSPWDDPAAAKAEIEKLRRENAAARTNAKAQAADEAKQQLTQDIAKALGLGEEPATDPAKLTEQLTLAQADAKRAQVELAVHRSAAASGGDPVALLDSTSFLKSLEGIDPSDTSAVSTAVAAAVEANPRLGVTVPDGEPKPPAPNPAQGAGTTASSKEDDSYPSHWVPKRTQ